MYVFYNIHQRPWVLTQSYIAGHELSKQVIKIPICNGIASTWMKQMLSRENVTLG